MWKFSVILLISASVLHLNNAQDQQTVEDTQSQKTTVNKKHNCPKNQHWEDCGTRCPARCNIVGRIGILCQRGCVRGCICDEGYMFKSGTSGPCVLPKDCPKIVPLPSPKPPEHNCLENQEWKDCGSMCPARCNIIGHMFFKCPNTCKPGCFCKEPYIFKSGTSGPCVLRKDCPKINPIPSPKPTEPKCPKNQHWEDKGTRCPHNCQNVGAKIKCTAETVAACFCNDGYVFQSGDSSSCVLIKDCPKPPEHNCSENQHWEDCGTACPSNCENRDNPPAACIDLCMRGCFCNKGYILQSEASGSCVLPQNCPDIDPVPSPKPTVPNCPKNQVWAECGKACPKNCENVGKKGRICPMYCAGACVCREPLVFQSGTSGPCVLPQDCPKIDPVPSPKPTEHNCSENQHWEEEGTLCPHNCQTVDALIKCIAGSKAACFCDEGYVFRSGESGPCVRTEDCPKSGYGKY